MRFECYRPDEYHVLLHIDCIINFNVDYMQKHMERKMDAKSHMDYVCLLGRLVSSNIPANDFVRLKRSVKE